VGANVVEEGALFTTAGANTPAGFDSASTARKINLDTSMVVKTGPENGGRTIAYRIYRRVS